MPMLVDETWLSDQMHYISMFVHHIQNFDNLSETTSYPSSLHFEFTSGARKARSAMFQIHV
jgi:hypothetical protein